MRQIRLLSLVIPTNRSLRRFGGMRDLLLAAEINIKKMWRKISFSRRGNLCN